MLVSVNDLPNLDTDLIASPDNFLSHIGLDRWSNHMMKILCMNIVIMYFV